MFHAWLDGQLSSRPSIVPVGKEVTENMNLSDLDEDEELIGPKFLNRLKKRCNSFNGSHHRVVVASVKLRKTISLPVILRLSRLSSFYPEPEQSAPNSYSIFSEAKPTASSTSFSRDQNEGLGTGFLYHWSDFKERLTSEVAHFQLCEHIIGELEAITFSASLPEPFRRAERTLVDAENLNVLYSSPRKQWKHFRNSTLQLSLLGLKHTSSCLGRSTSTSTLEEQSFQPKIHSDKSVRWHSLNSLLLPSHELTTYSLDDELHQTPSLLVPTQAALTAGGFFLRLRERFSSNDGDINLRLLRRLQEVTASLSDADWVDAQALATVKFLAHQNQLFPYATPSLSKTPAMSSVESLNETFISCTNLPLAIQRSNGFCSYASTVWSFSDYLNAASCRTGSYLSLLDEDRQPPLGIRQTQPAMSLAPTLSRILFKSDPVFEDPLKADGSTEFLAPNNEFLAAGAERFFRSRQSAARLGVLTSMKISNRDGQLITSIPVPKPKRRSILLGQRNHCAGCGVYVESKYLCRLRFCEYLGHFYCSVCHANTLMVVPGAVLHSWSFVMLPVSNFARDVLSRLHSRPLIHLSQFNSAVLKRQALLRDAIELRRQASRIVPFLKLCPGGADCIASGIDRLPSYLCLSADNWSISDLCSVADGSFGRCLRNALEPCVEHLSRCLRCKARGHLCEACHAGRVLFPFGQVKTVVCCDCGACFHRACISTLTMSAASGCTRCVRRKQRERLLNSPGDQSQPRQLATHSPNVKGATESSLKVPLKGLPSLKNISLKTSH